MKRIVLIDGENLSYAIRTFLGKTTKGKVKLASRDVLLGINYRGILEDVLAEDKNIHVLFFGVRMKRYSVNKEIASKTEDSIKRHSYLVNLLQKQGISFVKIGNLRPRESDPCENCGHKHWNLVEKGVDVGLAIRMVTEADKNTEIVLVSSDTDLLPAVRAAKLKGAKVMFVGYEFMPVLALASAADTTRIITKPIVDKNYDAGVVKS